MIFFISDSVTISGYTLTNKTRIRFRCHASDDEDDIYLDEIRVSARDDGTTPIDEIHNGRANSFALQQNYPNPFNPTTKIKYSIPMGSFVSLKVYDLLGREIMTLVNERKQKGIYLVEFDGTNLASGMYIYIIRVMDNNGSFVRSYKMNLIK